MRTSVPTSYQPLASSLSFASVVNGPILIDVPTRAWLADYTRRLTTSALLMKLSPDDFQSLVGLGTQCALHSCNEVV